MSKEKKENKPSLNKKNTALQKITIPVKNYLFAGIGVVLVILGFVMIAIDQNIDGFFALFVAPVFVVVGFLVVGFGIIFETK